MERRSSLRAILAAGIGGAFSASNAQPIAGAASSPGKDSAGSVTLGVQAGFVTREQLIAFLAELANASNLHKGVALIGGAGRVVDSIAALRALPKSGSPHAFVTGYYSPGDGGGGLYRYDATDVVAAENGGTIIVANDGGRWKLVHADAISVKQFGARGDDTTNDLAPIQAAHAHAARATLAKKFTVNGVASSYHGTVPRIIYPKGRYVVSDKIACGSYMIVEGDDAVIIQSDTAKRIFEGSNAFRWNVSGITFVGGSNQVYLANANIDSTLWNFENCKFVLSQDYAIKTAAVGDKYTHLSANLTFKNCLWDRPRKVLLNCCDYASIKDSWIHVNKQNFGTNADAFAFLNQANSSHPRLYLENVTGVPVMGNVGVDRVPQARWIDNYGDVIAIRTRFGGEDAGMSIVRHYKSPSVTYPFNPTQISLENCELYAGPTALADSCVVYCIEVPAIMRIKGCQGPVAAPYAIAPTLSFPAYFDAYAAAAHRPAWHYFKIDVDGNGGEFVEAGPHDQRIPQGLRPYLSKIKQAIVSRVSPQTINNGLADNFVSFDKVDFENCGAFSLSAPTILRIPLGATKIRVTFFAKIHEAFSGGVVSLRLLNDANITLVVSNQAHAANSDGIGIMLETDVFALPKAQFRISIRQDSNASTSIVQARATVTALDYVQ